MERSRLINNKYLVAGIIGAVLLVVTTIILVLVNQDDGIKNTQTAIEGLPKNIPANMKKLIGAGLYDAIALNLPEDQTPPKTGAVIRSGTLENEYDSTTRVHYGNFITDIESVQQSFKVHYEWSNEDDNNYISGYPVEIVCVDKDDRIYNTTSCSDAFHESDPTIDDFAEEYLPYTSKTTSGIDYNIIKDYPNREPVVTVVSYTCEGSKEASDVKKAASDWLKTVAKNINLGEIVYKNYCDGMMSDFPPVVKVR